MAATVVFDLTIAIAIGVLFSIVMFVVKVSDMQITISDVDPQKFKDNTEYSEKHKKTCVVYLSGPLYFGTSGKLEEAISQINEKNTLILSMRGVTMADISGVKALEELCEKLSEQNISVYFTCVQPNVMKMFERCGMTENIGKDMFFWSTDKALASI
jgi:SulP family sulfate permease